VPQAELLHAKIGAQLQQVIASGLCASVVTLKAATCGQFKTGHSEWAKT
jgi:hypothetical protein